MPMLAVRWLAGLSAALVAGSTVSQGWLSVADMQSQGGTALDGVWRYLGYFTVLTNSFIALVMVRAALVPGVRTGLNAPRVELMALTSILFVGVVYNTLLASRWDPHGLQKFNDVVLHAVAPLVFAAFWLVRPHGDLNWRDALFAAIWPAVYSVYGLARGAFDGFYPYFFMDPTQLSVGQLALNMAALILVFVAGAHVAVAFDRGFGRSRRQPQN